MTIRVLFVTLLTFVVAPLTAANRVGLTVTPSMAFAPADLQVRTSIPAVEGNRAVEIVAESHNFYASSEIALDGERAPETTTVEFKSVPVGTYSVRVIVKGIGGHEIASARTAVTVVGQ